MKANGRRYRRYQICIPVELLIGKDKLSLETADVGMSGVFVRTDARPKDGEFVRLGIDLPFDGGALELLGRITSVRRSSDPKRPSGVGVAFYGNGPNERDAWHRFVREIERRHPESAEKEKEEVSVAPAVESPPVVQPPALPRRKESAKAERRRYQRFEVLVEVKAYFDSIEDLVSMHTRDLSQGGMFIATSIVTAAGERLTLRVVHPKTKAEFPIPCRVIRCVSDAEQPGLAVEFQLDEDGRNDFWTFIGSAVAARTEARGRSVNYF